MNSKTRWGLVACGLVAAVFSVTKVRAGQKSAVLVSISTANRTAKGMLGTARASADANQYIGCSMEAGDNALPIVRCFAQNANGTVVSCSRTTISPGIGGSVSPIELGFLTTVASISNDSYLTFNWDASGKCTKVFVENSSDDQVKVF